MVNKDLVKTSSTKAIKEVSTEELSWEEGLGLPVRKKNSISLASARFTSIQCCSPFIKSMFPQRV